MIEKYIDLILTLGINLQAGDKVHIGLPVSQYEFANSFVKEAYKRGASIVSIDYRNEVLNRIEYDYQSDETLSNVYQHQIERDKLLAEENFKLVSVASPNPAVMEGVDSKKVQLKMSSYLQKCPMLRKNTASNLNSWCVVALANQEWADFATEGDLNKLENMIYKACRLDEDDYLGAWQTHIATLSKVAVQLNEQQFDSLHFTNELGTDLIVGLVKDHIWCAADDENGRTGERFVANMPTEEVFTMPHKNKVEGIVYSTKPLNFNGQIIDQFWIEFKAGKVTNYDAKVGLDALKSIITTDEGSSYLGEVALVSKHSPINKMDQLFFNTLFDENSSCHLALGNAYPTNIVGGTKMTADEKIAAGVNESKEHEDFMFGSEDMQVIGVKGEKQIVIFKDGQFVI